MSIKPIRFDLPATGVYVFPFMTNPALLLRSKEPGALVVELTPIEKGKPTEARCHIPLMQRDALRLAILILKQANEQGWPPLSDEPKHHPIH